MRLDGGGARRGGGACVVAAGGEKRATTIKTPLSLLDQTRTSSVGPVCCGNRAGVSAGTSRGCHVEGSSTHSCACAWGAIVLWAVPPCG